MSVVGRPPETLTVDRRHGSIISGHIVLGRKRSYQMSQHTWDMQMGHKREGGWMGLNERRKDASWRKEGGIRD